MYLHSEEACTWRQRARGSRTRKHTHATCNSSLKTWTMNRSMHSCPSLLASTSHLHSKDSNHNLTEEWLNDVWLNPQQHGFLKTGLITDYRSLIFGLHIFGLANSPVSYWPSILVTLLMLCRISLLISGYVFIVRMILLTLCLIHQSFYHYVWLWLKRCGEPSNLYQLDLKVRA